MTVNSACAHQPTLDVSQLESLADLQGDGQPDLIVLMVDMFLDETRRRIDEATAALASGDVAVVRRSAHSIRGACGVVGAQRLGVLAGILEEAAATTDGDRAGMIAAIAEEFVQAQVLLRPYLAKTEKSTR